MSHTVIKNTGHTNNENSMFLLFTIVSSNLLQYNLKISHLFKIKFDWITLKIHLLTENSVLCK